MRIKNIELVGYKRLALNQVRRLYIDFREDIELILGTNGSGKSSLLKELSPLPAVPADYEKDGSKAITIEHNKSVYYLTSRFGSTNEHSFLKDGTELNQGRTGTVQKELCFKEFGITPEIHELFTGLLTFNSMPVAQRRKWFTLLSRTDYTYAFSVYNKFKEKLRDIQGALRINENRLIQESKKILDIEQETQTRSYIDWLKEVKDSLLEIDAKYSIPTIQVKDKIIENYASISKMVSNIKKLFRNHYIYSGLIDTSGNVNIVELDNYYYSELKVNKTLIDNNAKLLESKESLLHLLKDANSNSLDEVYTAINAKKLEIANHTKLKSPIALIFEDNKAAQNALATVQDNLISIFKEIEIDEHKRYNRDFYKETKEKQELLMSEISQLDAMYLRAINAIKDMEHLKEHNKTECPKCMHTWVRDYNEIKHKELVVNRDNLNKLLIEKKDKLKEYEKLLEDMTTFFQYIIQYNKLVQYWTILTPLWKYIQDIQLLYKDPRSINVLLNTIYKDIELDIEIEKLTVEIKNHSSLIDGLKQDNNKDVSERQKEIEEIHDEIYRLDQSNRDITRKLENIDKLQKTIDELENTSTRMNEILVANENLEQSWLNGMFKQYLRGLLQIVNLEIEKEENIILQIDRQKALVDSIELQNEKYKKDIDALKILVTEMSPQEGLIAKGMLGFINVFLAENNSILKKIWSYPLELVLVEVDEESELDYKFAIKINDNSTIPDIQKVSSGIKEVLDLSFKLVAMKHLGMQDYPIFLDEFGKAMDSKHRHQAIETIKSLIYSSNFSQIFIVSHYESSYGSFKNSQVNVLCDNNVVIPKDMIYNEHMRLET